MDKVAVSKNKFFFWAVVIAILNPVFSGLILGLFMLSEPNLRKEGKIVALFSIAWGVIAMLLLARFKGVLPI